MPPITCRWRWRSTRPPVDLDDQDPRFFVRRGVIYRQLGQYNEDVTEDDEDVQIPRISTVTQIDMDSVLYAARYQGAANAGRDRVLPSSVTLCLQDEHPPFHHFLLGSHHLLYLLAHQGIHVTCYLSIHRSIDDRWSYLCVRSAQKQVPVQVSTNPDDQATPPQHTQHLHLH